MRENDRLVEKTKQLYENRLNWDNEFIVRFKLDNNETLKCIPNNIFSVELPTIEATDIAENDVNKLLKVTLRSSYDGSVESEVFNTLFRTSFNVEVSLSNPNIVAWEYNSCTVDKVEFSQLVDKKSKANPLNLTLYIKVSQIVYTGNGTAASSITFGEKVPDRAAIESESLVKKETKKD